MPLVRMVTVVVIVLMPATVTDTTKVMIVKQNMSCAAGDWTESGA